MNFPNDPLLRLLPSEVPRSFEMLPPDEQRWRGRVFLMTWSLGGNVAISWQMALDDEPEHIAEMKQLAEESDDDLIRATVRGRREAEESATRLGYGDVR